MKTRMVMERIGEWTTPIDLSYDWLQHRSLNNDVAKIGRDQILKMETGKWKYRPDFNSWDVVRVGMYDGWPYWVPTPAIGYIGPLGGIR